MKSAQRCTIEPSKEVVAVLRVRFVTLVERAFQNNSTKEETNSSMVWFNLHKESSLSAFQPCRKVEKRRDALLVHSCEVEGIDMFEEHTQITTCHVYEEHITWSNLGDSTLCSGTIFAAKAGTSSYEQCFCEGISMWCAKCMSPSKENKYGRGSRGRLQI